MPHLDPEWLKQKTIEDGDEGEIGAGFELFPIPDAIMQPLTLKPCEKDPYRYCNCEGFYPACRQAPASNAGDFVAMVKSG